MEERNVTTLLMGIQSDMISMKKWYKGRKWYKEYKNIHKAGDIGDKVLICLACSFPSWNSSPIYCPPSTAKSHSRAKQEMGLWALPDVTEKQKLKTKSLWIQKLTLKFTALSSRTR